MPFNYNQQTGVDQVAKAYQEKLGRAATSGEAESWLMGGPGAQYAEADPNSGQWGDWVNHRIDELGKTEEAYNYQNKKNTAPPPPPPASGGSGGGGQATGSPVTATGQIVPQASSVTSQMAPMPTPATRGAEPNQTRYVQPVDFSQAPAYKPTQFTAQAPQVPEEQTALLHAILSNPETMNPSVVAQLKEAQKQQALLMGQQAHQTLDQSNIAGGRFGSGGATANGMNIDSDVIGKILDANRGVDISAASTNRQDQLNALQAAISQGTQGLANAQFGHQVESDQAGENFKSNQSAISRLLAQFGVNSGVADNAQQNYAADLSSTLGANSNILDVLKYLENTRQFNDTLGYNYNALDQSGQQSLMQFLFNNNGY